MESAVQFLKAEQASFHSWHGLANHSNSDIDSPTPPSSFHRRHSARGSMRKVLPAVPDMETQMNMSAKMIDKRTSTPKGNHSYGPFFLEYSLLAEYNLLQKQKLPGVYVIPSCETSLCWFGIIFLRQGIYQEGIFRFRLLIPENYPDGDCPRLLFDHAVYHPLVDPNTHELDVKRLFVKWKRNVNHIWQILSHARRSFYKIETKDGWNVEAAAKYDSDLDGFKADARACVQEWKDRIYEQPAASFSTDPHFPSFSPYQAHIHEPVRATMMAEARKHEASAKSGTHSIGRKGHSFLEPGSLKIFSSRDNNTT